MTRRCAAAVLAAAVTFMAPAVAAAHADLINADPSADAVLDTPPFEVVLTFDKEIDGSLVVVDAAGTEVGSGELDLNVADRNVLRGTFGIQDRGQYTVRWSVTDVSDGDTTDGELTFTVGSGASTGGETAPDTAVIRANRSAGATALGMVVLAAAAVLAMRRSRRCA